MTMNKRICAIACLLSLGSVLTACGTNGSEPGSAVNVAGTLSAAPVPSGVSVSTAGANQLKVSWQPVDGASSYNLYYSTQNGVTTTTGTKIANVSPPYTHTNVPSNVTYYYVVTAVSSARESPPSTQVSATSVTIPAAPLSVSAAGGSNQAVISWGMVGNATSYNIYWSTHSGVTKNNGTKISNARSPFVHGGLGANITYYYIVTAVNSADESSPSNEVSATTSTIAGIVPSEPSGVTANGGTNQAVISWNPVSDATSYNIYWSRTSHVMNGMSLKITGVTSPYRHTDLSSGIEYYYAVTALNGAGESVESTIVSAATSATDGVSLYRSECSSCHGTLTLSTKTGRTASQIQAAINGNRGGMGVLSHLTPVQIQAIADVTAW